MKTVVVCESFDTTALQIEAAVQGVPGTRVLRSNSLETAGDMCRAQGAQALVVGPSLVGESAFELASRLRAESRVATVLVAASPDTTLMRQAMRAGIADVLPIDAPKPEMVETIMGAIDRSLAEQGVPDGESAATGGKVITVFSTKGGVGKTILATNMATSLAKFHRKSVALVDLDLQFGDVGIMMGLPPTHTIYDAVQAFERLDVAMIQGYLVEHSSGVKALLAPIHPEDAEIVTANRVLSILRLLRTVFDFVVVDTAPAFDDVSLAVLDSSDAVFVVTMMDVASVKNTRISLQKLRQLGYDQSAMRLILNRADSKVLLNVSDVEAAIGGSISGRIPSDLVVPRSVNRGTPVVLDAPKSNVSKSIISMAGELLRQFAEKGGQTNVA